MKKKKLAESLEGKERIQKAKLFGEDADSVEVEAKKTEPKKEKKETSTENKETKEENDN